MTFYYESLSNLIAYGDLRTNVFHQFTQVGNAIIFSLLLEQTLVRFFFLSRFLNFSSLFLSFKIEQQCFAKLSITKRVHKRVYDCIAAGHEH